MSSPTSKIKVFIDVKFQPGSTLTRDTRNSFPLNPEVGMDTMVNGVYYYYGMFVALNQAANTLTEDGIIYQ